jgi:hypothetical protein
MLTDPTWMETKRMAAMESKKTLRSMLGAMSTMLPLRKMRKAERRIRDEKAAEKLC